MTHYTPLFDIDQARAIDREAQLAIGLSEYALMHRAGKAAWRELLRRWSRMNRIGVVCGPGNNGGDGYVLACLARASGRDVVVVRLTDCEPRTDSARQAFAAWAAGGREVRVFDGVLPVVDLWVDALFGIGFACPPDGASHRLIEAINAAGVDIFSLDVPSGIDAKTGKVLGAAIRATRTLSFLVDKCGLHTGAALDHAGVLRVDALGVTAPTISKHSPAARLVRKEALADWLPRRKLDSNKGEYGHVLCVGGDHGTGGAIALTAEAALRSGSGLVSVATRAEHVAMLLARRPELMVRGIEESADFDALSERASVLAIGPGLGKGEWGRALFTAVLKIDKPMVIDADALNLIAESPRSVPHAVLTPHPGEAGRLLGIPTSQVQADRFAAARELAKRYDCCVVLKGAGTIVAAPDAAPVVIGAGNPGMATGGMGDALTGVIAAMLAQKMNHFDAAVCGALLHAVAGDAAAAVGGERGLLASDLFPHLRKLANPCG